MWVSLVDIDIINICPVGSAVGPLIIRKAPAMLLIGRCSNLQGQDFCLLCLLTVLETADKQVVFSYFYFIPIQLESDPITCEIGLHLN